MFVVHNPSLVNERYCSLRVSFIGERNTRNSDSKSFDRARQGSRSSAGGSMVSVLYKASTALLSGNDATKCSPLAL
jgi:hypothetical protein